MAANFDREEILRTWQVFRQPGEVLELRIPKAGRSKTISGYFNDAEKLADAVVGLADEPFAGIYFTVNPVKPDLLARASNKYVKYAETTTNDSDITVLHWLPGDLDAKRPAGISSTDGEHEAAINKAREIRHWLIEDQGWPASAFVLGDSGNGGHLNVKIDLPNLPENVTLVKDCLEAWDFLFSDKTIEVDTTSQNPARIWKIYGTMARKGDSTAERPHRLARLLEVPESFETVSREKLEVLAAMLPEQEEQPKTYAVGRGFDPVAYCKEHNLAVHHTKTWRDPKGQACIVAVLEQCIFNPDHHLSACIIGWPNGMRSYRCKHNSCINLHWKDAKRILEPERARNATAAGQNATRVEGKPSPTVIEAIRALDTVCDGATSKDGTGFNKFDRQKNASIIDQALEEGYLDPKDEMKAYRLLKKYTKQLKTLGIEYSEIGMIDGGREADDGTVALLERIPEWIEEHHFKTVGDTEKIYHYDHGVYLDDGEKVLKECLGTEFPTLLNNKLVSDVVGNVKRRTYVDRDSFNNRNILNVKNGLIDLETGELKPHTHEYFTTAQLNVTYDPKALCPAILKFLDDVAQPCDVELLKELIGWLLWPDYHIHKAVMLVGIGRNGKGTLLRLITKFLGDRSISNVTLQELVGDQFAKADLYGKMANIGGDLPAKDLSDTAAFRNATGGDRLRAQEKFKSAFGFTNKAKMWFSANVVPRSNDDTFAFYARWFLIEFLNLFTLENGKADPDLDSKLQTDEELSGLLNIALAKLKTLRASGWKFSYNKTVEQVEVMYKRNSNPVYAFLIDECLPGVSTDIVEKTVFWNRFNKYIKDHNLRPLSTTKFGTLLKDQTEIPVNSYKLWTQSGDRPMCWQGVKFKDPNLPAFIKVGVMQRSDANPGLLSTPLIVKLDYTEIFGNNQEKENKKIGRIEKTIDGLDEKDKTTSINDEIAESEQRAKENDAHFDVTKKGQE